MLLLLDKPEKAVGTFRALPWYEQSCCSDFRYESNGIFVLRVGFFFFRQISTFYLAIFDEIF